LDVKTAYISSIPEDAVEKVRAKQADGARKRAEYFLNGELVGERSFHSSGELEYEHAFRNGVKHGWQYRWDTPGELLSAEPYENGVPHGTAYQWASDGRLLGTYTLEHGTGIDLWWQDWMDGTVDLAEVHYMRNGLSHGFELNGSGTLKVGFGGAFLGIGYGENVSPNPNISKLVLSTQRYRCSMQKITCPTGHSRWRSKNSCLKSKAARYIAMRILLNRSRRKIGKRWHGLLDAILAMNGMRYNDNGRTFTTRTGI
jgi:hypothetical protein